MNRPHQPQSNLGRLIRRGLSESLEEFTARAGGPTAKPEKYRHCWALQGLRFLGVVPPNETWEVTVQRVGDGARLAPDLAVPTRFVGDV